MANFQLCWELSSEPRVGKRVLSALAGAEGLCRVVVANGMGRK